MYLSSRHWLSARKPVSATRRARGCSIKVGLLEGRLLLSGDLTAPSTNLQALLVDGRHTVPIYSVDQSGNQEVTQTRTFNNDSTTPIVTASAPPVVTLAPQPQVCPGYRRGARLRRLRWHPRSGKLPRHRRVRAGAAERHCKGPRKRQVFLRRTSSVEPPGARQGWSAILDCRLGDRPGGQLGLGDDFGRCASRPRASRGQRARQRQR